MNNGAAQVPQDNISFMVFILLPVFLQLNEGVTDFIESAERKSSSLSFALDTEEFWLFFFCQRLLWNTIPDYIFPCLLRVKSGLSLFTPTSISALPRLSAPPQAAVSCLFCCRCSSLPYLSKNP